MVTETGNKRIAVLSGKGGTGKTFLTVNLAAVAGPSVYIDCDVEEPNGHLFFRPDAVTDEAVTVRIPQVDPLYVPAAENAWIFAFHALALPNSSRYSTRYCMPAAAAFWFARSRRSQKPTKRSV